VGEKTPMPWIPYRLKGFKKFQVVPQCSRILAQPLRDSVAQEEKPLILHSHCDDVCERLRDRSDVRRSSGCELRAQLVIGETECTLDQDAVAARDEQCS